MKSLYRFFHSDISGGIILMLAAALAMAVANSPFADTYNAFLDQTLTIGFTSEEGVAEVALQKPLLLWINDFLMAFFFLLAGLEIKREIRVGALSSLTRAMLPVVAAAGGMLMPALVYLGINAHTPEFHHGWAIPSATDIAFALGVLALVSSRVPIGLKVLLTAIAVIDDLGAILIIALFYTDHIQPVALMIGAGAAVALLVMNRVRITAYTPYFMVGFILWVAMLKGGLHPTLAGVLTAFAIPTMSEDKDYSPLEELEHMLKPWVVFFILPLFGFANAGVSLAGMGFDDMLHPVTLGVAAGLFFGKQVGIFGSIWAMVKLHVCDMPDAINWWHIYGMSLLCGIGFTMALFIGGLAFSGHDMAAYVRMGVIAGSILSALVGYAVLVWAARRPAMDY